MEVLNKDQQYVHSIHSKLHKFTMLIVRSNGETARFYSNDYEDLKAWGNNGVKIGMYSDFNIWYNQDYQQSWAS